MPPGVDRGDRLQPPKARGAVVSPAGSAAARIAVGDAAVGAIDVRDLERAFDL